MKQSPGKNVPGEVKSTYKGPVRRGSSVPQELQEGPWCCSTEHGQRAVCEGHGKSARGLTIEHAAGLSHCGKAHAMKVCTSASFSQVIVALLFPPLGAIMMVWTSKNFLSQCPGTVWLCLGAEDAPKLLGQPRSMWTEGQGRGGWSALPEVSAPQWRLEQPQD